MFKRVTHGMALCKPQVSVWINNILCGILNYCTCTFIGVNGGNSPHGVNEELAAEAPQRQPR